MLDVLAWHEIPLNVLICIFNHPSTSYRNTILLPIPVVQPRVEIIVLISCYMQQL
jgi:hypothetical protein